MEAFEIIFLSIPLIILFIILGVAALVGWLVYKDAKKANMNAVVWALTAALVPSFLGLIVYLIVRSLQPSPKCTNCGAPIDKSYACCPKCGFRLRMKCPTCGAMVEHDWKACSACGTPVAQAVNSSAIKP